MDISLRPVTERDFDFLWELNVATMRDYVERTWGWDEQWQRRDFEEKFNSREADVVTVNGTDVGYLRVEDREDCLFIASIQIASDFQNQGIGTRLVRDIIDKSDKPVTLQVLKVNPAALRLYERLGFTVAADRGTYFDLTNRPD